MNPYDEENSVPNFWLSCMLIHKDAMCKQVRGDTTVTYETEAGKTCPSEILDALAAINAEGRPIWKPMHMQPIYRENAFVAREAGMDVGADIFERGLCLPSDIKMTVEEQDRVIAAVRKCFD
jgi:dTDP-4-amino-4,6-dideoxygalactose transaminase